MRSWVDNLLGCCRVASIASKVVAAVDPEQKQRVLNHAEDKGLELVDHKVVGDFDLALFHYRNTHLFPAAPDYIVALSSGPHDPFDDAIIQETQRTTNYSPIKQSLSEVAQILEGWLVTYGKLAAGSANKRKQDLYRLILSKLLPLRSFELAVDPDHPEFGFYIK
jgi:hypothetical protein